MQRVILEHFASATQYLTWTEVYGYEGYTN